MLPVKRPKRFDLAAVIVAASGLATTASAQQDHSWTVGDGNWSRPLNWSPLGVPSGLGDNAFIGNFAGVENATVFLDEGISSNGALMINSLTLTSGMTLDTNNRTLVVNDAFLNDGTVIVRPASQVSGAPLPDGGFAGRMWIGADGHLQLEDGRAFFAASSFNSGLISGRGEIIINRALPGQFAFRNDSIIAPDNNGGIQMTTTDIGGPRDAVDLDGVAEQGIIDLTTPFSILNLTSGGLTTPSTARSAWASAPRCS